MMTASTFLSRNIQLAQFSHSLPNEEAEMAQRKEDQLRDFSRSLTIAQDQYDLQRDNLREALTSKQEVKVRKSGLI